MASIGDDSSSRIENGSPSAFDWVRFLLCVRYTSYRIDAIARSWGKGSAPRRTVRRAIAIFRIERRVS